MSQQLELYCKTKDVDELRDELALKVDITKLEELEKYVNESTYKIEAAEEYAEVVDYKFEELREQLTLKSNAKESKAALARLSKDVQFYFAQAALKTTCHADKEALEKQISKQGKEIDKLKRAVATLKQRADGHDDDLETKVELEELGDLKELVLRLPNVEEVDEMRAYVSSSIETFQLDNINFNKDFQTQNEIIRRYDEVLSQKASKQLIEEKIIQQDERLQKQLKNVHAITDSLAEELRTAGKKLDDFKVLMFEEVATQVQSISKKEKQMGTRAVQQESANSGGLSAEAMQNMKRLMALKADKTEIERLYELKSNKVDQENILDVQTIMSKQFKHVLVLFIEIINCQTMKAKETKNGLEQRIQNLISQVQALSTWVMNFDPLDYMNSADAANIQL